MDHGQFDELSRNVFVNLGARRTLLRFLAASAIGGAVARLGFDEEVEAKARKQHGQGHKDQKRSGQVQAAGKKHKKQKKGKGKGKDKDQPTPPTGCPAGFRECYGTTTCVGPKECCPFEQKCGDGECLPQDSCCPEHDCGGGVCRAPDECCPVVPLCAGCQEAVCKNGGWECHFICAADETCLLDVCIPTCSNGCHPNDGSGTCDKAPEGKTYCAGQDRCVPTCGPDKSLDPATCTCVAWGSVCRPGYQDCRNGDVCCGGRCIACPQGGRCEDKVCYGCAGANTVSCPPSPLWPSGFCCPPESGGRPFKYCHPPYEPPHMGWGCYYENSIDE